MTAHHFSSRTRTDVSLSSSCLSRILYRRPSSHSLLVLRKYVLYKTPANHQSRPSRAISYHIKHSQQSNTLHIYLIPKTPPQNNLSNPSITSPTNQLHQTNKHARRKHLRPPRPRRHGHGRRYPRRHARPGHRYVPHLNDQSILMTVGSWANIVCLFVVAEIVRKSEAKADDVDITQIGDGY